jgi:23S rRNA (cytosine1962-C5)-methyltransferase
MTPLSTVLLKPGEADRVLAGHPWIYHGSIIRVTQPAADGDLVQVKDHRQRLLGIGFYNSKSKINVRMIAPERVEVNQAFFEGRIRAALAVRRRHLPQASSFRVVNSESDLLSGLIVDKYEDVLVMQTSALGMDRRKSDIVAALQSIFSPRAIVERNEVASRKFEGLPDASGVLAGSLGTPEPECARPRAQEGTQGLELGIIPAPSETRSLRPGTAALRELHGQGEVIVKLNGLQFQANLLSGHKTGFYLDQQVNYQRVSEFVPMLPGAQVLDCFSFLGGFGLHAARAGATNVHLLDQSAEVIEASKRNAQLNGLADKCSFEAVNVFDWLKAQTVVKPNEKVIPRFDLIILDPPSFTRNRAAVPDALRGYKEIHLRALKLLKPDGVLATFCCSHHVNAELFQEVVLAAAYDARRLLRRVAVYGQSPDHPVLPAIAETEYLKGFAFEMVRS